MAYFAPKLNDMDFNALVKFLSGLKKNNNKEWFEKNRKTYEALRKDWITYVEQMIKKVGAFDQSVAGLDAKKCIFRINRDIRFSADKSPYKTNFGASMSRSGNKTDFCGYYFHVSPDEIFLAGGSYMPMPDQLAKVRQEIDYNFDELKKILGNKEFKKHFEKMTGDKLSRPPKGYEESNPAIDYLKYKSFLMVKNYNAKDLDSKNFDKEVLTVFKAMKPLNDFLDRALRD